MAKAKGDLKEGPPQNQTQKHGGPGGRRELAKAR